MLGSEQMMQNTDTATSILVRVVSFLPVEDFPPDATDIVVDGLRGSCVESGFPVCAIVCPAVELTDGVVECLQDSCVKIADPVKELILTTESVVGRLRDSLHKS